jgi:hypothetical protein
VFIFQTFHWTEGAIKNEQSRETGIKGHTWRKKQKKQTQYVLDNNKLKNVSKTWALLQATGNKDDELFLCDPTTIRSRLRRPILREWKILFFLEWIVVKVGLKTEVHTRVKYIKISYFERMTTPLVPYNYLCNQCLSLLTLWVRTPFRRGVLDTALFDKVGQWLATGRNFSQGTPVLHQWNCLPRYKENIVKSGVKHHDILFLCSLNRNMNWSI